MKKIREMSLGELAAFVSTHLRKNGIECILSGGGCVSIYTANRYQSYDLDFIESVSSGRKAVRKILGEIGFLEKNRYFKHPDIEYLIEFPSGPLSVGGQPIQKTVTLSFATGQLTLLSPTDCIKDRLAAYFHWNDMQCLEQARLVSESNRIDIGEIRRWSKAENKLEEFESIREMLSMAPKRNKTTRPPLKK
jgi:hypothetical protein